MQVRAGGILAVLLGLGSVDLGVLNMLVFPAVFTATDVSASRDVQDATLPPTAPAVQDAPTPDGTQRKPSAAAVNAAAVPATQAPEPALMQPQAVVPPGTAETTIMPPPAAEGMRIEVLFGLGNWAVGPQAKRALASSIEDVVDSQSKIEVIGHADAPGSRSLNQRLSELRAETVRDLLTRSGIDAARISAWGVGEDNPSADGRDRRVDILIGGTP
ncbi:MAG: OmpA family protein [Polyangiales bacterium]